MKKLSKKSLDELAQVMPVIREVQQKKFVGGALYFNENGQRLGQIGDDEFRVITQAEYNSNYNSLLATPTQTLGVSIADDSVSGVAETIYQGYVNDYLAAHGRNSLDMKTLDGPVEYAHVYHRDIYPPRATHSFIMCQAGYDPSCALAISGSNLNIYMDNSANLYEWSFRSGLAAVDANYTSGCYHNTIPITGSWSGSIIDETGSGIE